MKTCAKCKISKHEKEFNSRRKGLSRHSYCKPCLSVYSKERYKKPEVGNKIRAYSAQYKKQHPENVKSNQLKMNYGINKEQWDAIFEKQGHKCAMCGSLDPGPNCSWATDHDHSKNEKNVRGIICTFCNSLLGYAKDNPSVLQSGINYLLNQKKFSKEAWIETYSGLRFSLLDPDPKKIKIEDIAHALSQLCRFTGHVKWLYTVGQHSLIGSYLVPPQDALWFLLHDASEAYIGDMNRPFKHFTGAGSAYIPVEKNIMHAVCECFGLPMEEPASVRAVDNAMLFAEKEQLMAPIDWDHDWGCSTKPANVLLVEMTPREVEARFLERFKFLTHN